MQNENSVCFVGKIQEINPIPGADKIEQAIISGWECVIAKNQHIVGELVIIAVTDAVIPVELAEKLGVLGYLKHRKKAGVYTVKTTKLKGVYSTAMVIGQAATWREPYSEGEDVMKDYNITKYEEPEVQVTLASGQKIRTSKHPDFHVYHKFPNAKNVQGMFNENDDIKITRKVHGCNARYGIVRKPHITLLDRIKKWFGNKLAFYDYVYGSHQVEKGVNSVHFYEKDVWANIGDKYEIESKLRKWALNMLASDNLNEGIILYGEIYGPGIQKYYDYGLKELELQLFDVKGDGNYLSTYVFEKCAEWLDIPKVEVYYEGKYNEEEIKKWQFGRYFTNASGQKIPEEGVVVSAIDGSREKIAKFINPEYLEFQSKKEDSTDFH